MAKQLADEDRVERLRQDIARDRARLAVAIAVEPRLPEAEPTTVGRLYRIFTLMSEY